MGLEKAKASEQYLIIGAIMLIANLGITHNSAPLHHPTNISKLWEPNHSSKYINTDVLQIPSSSSFPKSNRVRRRSLEKNPKVNYYAAGDSQNEKDYYYEEDTSNIKLSKTVESPQPEQPQQSFPPLKQPTSPVSEEDGSGTAKLQSKAKDSRNIEINVALPRLQPYIPINPQPTDVENYDSLEIPKNSAIVTPENDQPDTKSLKSVADEVADLILNDADRLYESLLNGNFTAAVPNTNQITCNDDSAYILC